MTISKRDVLATLSKPELLEIGRRSELEVQAKMSKDDLLDRIAPAERAELAKILPTLAYESLKAACRDLGLPSDGREKADFASRLLAAATPAGQAVPQAAPRAADDYTIELWVEPREPRLAWQGIDRKEAVVWVPTQVVEIVRPGRARDQSDSLLKGDTKTQSRPPGARESAPLPENRLIWTNDNLVALQTLLDEKDPRTNAARYAGKVDLIYIDPPFMVNNDFRTDNTIDIDIDKDEKVQAKKEPSLVEHLAYRDTWRQGLDSFLSMMKRRLELLKEFLAPTGSIYVHLDWHAVHYVKVLMDQIFGYGNFINEIIWASTNAHNDADRFGSIHQTILSYSGGGRPYFNPPRIPYSPEYIQKYFTRSDERGKFRPGDLTAPGIRHGETGVPWRGIDPTSKGRHWAYPPNRTGGAQQERAGLLYVERRSTPQRVSARPGWRSRAVHLG